MLFATSAKIAECCWCIRRIRGTSVWKMYANFNIIVVVIVSRIVVVVGHINFVAQVVDKETPAIIFDTTCYCNTVSTDKLDTLDILNIFLTVKVYDNIIYKLLSEERCCNSKNLCRIMTIVSLSMMCTTKLKWPTEGLWWRH